MENNDSKKIIAVSIVKNQNGEVLILKKKPREKDKNGPSITWVFPGGLIEVDETELQAAARETLDETGYTVTPNDVISRRTFPNSNVYINYVACSLVSTDVIAISDIDEVEEVKWVLPNQLKDFFTSDLDKVVAVYLGLL